MSLRSLARELVASCGSVQNRLDRLARQGIALHSLLRPRAALHERVCFDGLVSFDRSQYYPSDIGLSISSRSRFILGLSHATTRRSGALSEAQRNRIESVYEGSEFEKKAIERSFSEHLDLLADEERDSRGRPLIIVTDEKLEYVRALHAHQLYLCQDERHRCAQLQVPSTLPRSYANPLFASNYLDREIRKDQANHRRESTCYSRNAANCMTRLASYLVWHNYEKRYLVKWKVDRNETHAEMAGIDRDVLERGRTMMFTKRAFLSRLSLAAIDLWVWMKRVYDPIAGHPTIGYLPKYAFG
ncbi:MAG: hypothetical protein H7A27_00330 [Spirochaetaceae bacterium]|nr:hypothetical protein [Spirochaetaceae bacterium]